MSIKFLSQAGVTTLVEKIKQFVSGNFLKLSGGTVTGEITANVLKAWSLELATKVPYIDFHFDSSPSDYTARMINPADGWFNIEINNTSGQSKTLTIRADGTMTWDGSNVLTTASGNAVSSTVAAKLARHGNIATPMTFNWTGQEGQPTWMWGGNDSDPSNMYVYNPGNFNVASASKLTTARTIDGVSFDGTANISTFYKGTSAPSNTACLWINTSNNTLNYYNGSSWVAIRGVYA